MKKSDIREFLIEDSLDYLSEIETLLNNSRIFMEVNIETKEKILFDTKAIETNMMTLAKIETKVVKEKVAVN